MSVVKTNKAINGNVLVYPEIYTKNPKFYIDKSKELQDTIVIGGCPQNKIYAIIAKNGKIVGIRDKYKLTKWENFEVGTIPKPLKVNNLNILIIICYELCFPSLWQKQFDEKVDLLIHLVGTPMFNEKQANRWVELQKRMSEYHKCPLICSVGNSRPGIDISGVIYP